MLLASELDGILWFGSRQTLFEAVVLLRVFQKMWNRAQTLSVAMLPTPLITTAYQDGEESPIGWRTLANGLRMSSTEPHTTANTPAEKLFRDRPRSARHSVWIAAGHGKHCVKMDQTVRSQQIMAILAL